MGRAGLAYPLGEVQAAVDAAVPETECTVVAVITDAASHRKFVITDLKLVPKIAVLDPETLKIERVIAEGLLPGVHDVSFGADGRAAVAVTGLNAVVVLRRVLDRTSVSCPMETTGERYDRWESGPEKAEGNAGGQIASALDADDQVLETGRRVIPVHGCP